MDDRTPDCRISPKDLRAALKEMHSYVDVTEEDLKKIYEIALRHARQRAVLRIAVHEVMTREVVTIGPDANIHEAARLLSENRISGMPVVDEGNQVLGVISEADVLMLAGWTMVIPSAISCTASWESRHRPIKPVTRSNR
jgi:CBS domain-containing membrane protein